MGNVRPNILWIVATQWRACATGYGGDQDARTPWLDALASQSYNFSEAVTPHPMGPQARAALLTGQLCPENGVGSYWDPLPSTSRTIAHALNERGYATAFFGKWHLGPRNQSAPFVGTENAKLVVSTSHRGGFEFWEGFEGGFLLNDPWLHGSRLSVPTPFKGYQSDILAQRTAEWINRTHSRPYFCVLSVEAPHPPYDAPAAGVRRIDPAAISLRPNVPRGGTVEAQARRELSGYLSHIEATDRSIGKLIAEIDLSNTFVVFTSVHGDMHGSHGLFRKAWPYEESLRVPFLIKPANALPSGETQQSAVSLLDLSHMAVAWANERNWLPERESVRVSMPDRTSIPLQCDRAWKGIRTKERKLILNSDGSPWLFFDLVNDPFEEHNLVSHHSRAAEIESLIKLI